MITVVINGNVVKDPTTVKVKDTEVTKITVASNRNYKNKDDQWESVASFLDIEAWGSLSTSVSGYKKGDSVNIVGSLEQQNWEKDGEKRSKLVCKALQTSMLRRKDAGEKPSDEKSADGNEVPF